jgi:hypothetical protein
MSRVPRAPFIRCSGGCLLANPFGVTAESLQFVVVAFWLVRVKPIRLSDHAQRYASKRGFTLNEVEDVIRTAPWRRLNSDGSNVERISRTEKNGTVKCMRPNKFGRCSSRRRWKLLW